uniref:Peptidase M14 domain-containing protein n=1 Tax=Glossina austeni TaxID=7395 RepID=A0A1A9VMH3_GLOAU
MLPRCFHPGLGNPKSKNTGTMCKQKRKFSRKKFDNRPLDWLTYHTLNEIYHWLDQIIQTFPKVVKGFALGRSYEGRLIRGIKISFRSGRKAIFIESNIHAREWITSAAVTYLIKELLFSTNVGVRKVAESVDWWIIPVLNVDGFVYTHEKDRSWRKSRKPSSPNCFGTDLNRNFDFQWGALGDKSDPCSVLYPGPHPESEPEIEQLVEFINQNIPDGSIKIYIALHSAAQLILSPWSHTEDLPGNYNEMMFVAQAFVQSLYTRYGTEYTFGTSANKLGKFSGGSKDWAYAVKGIPIAFTIELPDKGEFGFDLPEQMILPASKELVDGFVGMIKAVKQLGYI